jgi:hypothetical protein
MAFSITILSKMAFSITTLSKMPFNVMTNSRKVNEKDRPTQHPNECHSAECH